MSASDTLLAVDLGIRSGLAVYDRRGHLLDYRSTNFGSRRRLKQAVYGVIRDAGPPAHLIVEGDRNLGQIWQRAGAKLGAQYHAVTPKTWRQAVLQPHQRRDAATAKQAADTLARRVIELTGADRPTSLRHDAAEAILIGWWALHHLGWREPSS